MNFQPQHARKPPGRSSRNCYQFSLPTTSLSRHVATCIARVRSIMLHASETWPLTKPNLQYLQRNDRAIIRQICNVTVGSNELLAQLGIKNLDLILKQGRLPWYGRERANSAVKKACDIQVDGKHGPGRPKMTWKH